MRTIYAQVLGAERPVHVVDDSSDLEQVRRDILAAPGPMAIDTETTGLEIFGSAFGLRLAQIGNREQAWVFVIEGSTAAVLDCYRRVVAGHDRLLAQNAMFDLLVLDRFDVLDMEETYDRIVDTRILAHLLDPRSANDGGVGHSLEPLVSHYYNDPTADRYAAPLKALFRQNKWKVSEGYTRVPLDTDLFLRYSGADVMHTAWLYEALAPLVQGRGFGDLRDFEHKVQRVAAVMTRRGVLVDADYAAELKAYLLQTAAAAEQKAATFGIENVNSTKQVASVLSALGATLTERTPAGDVKVDKAVLKAVADHQGGLVAEVAGTVLEAKNAHKFASAYVGNVMASLGADGRSHPWVHSLQARTARMSISDPPLQQLPSGDWRVRRMFVAGEGNLIGAADYEQVELRVVAGLSQERAMLDAIRDGVDLHTLTADRVGIDRKIAKGLNFALVYGGGQATIARQCGISETQARDAIKGFRRAYPTIARYQKQLVRGSDQGRRPVVTATGRQLPLDRNRVYAACNYVVQSTARDILAQALVSMYENGLSDYLLLPVHDEVIFEAPADIIEDVARRVGETMSMDILGTHIAAEGEVYGPSWGHGYGAPS
jgi:DNA polymerase-1